MMKMNSILAMMMAAGVMLSGQAVAADKTAVTFTPEQEARIGEVARDYLLAHKEN